MSLKNARMQRLIIQPKREKVEKNSSLSHYVSSFPSGHMGRPMSKKSLFHGKKAGRKTKLSWSLAERGLEKNGGHCYCMPHSKMA